MSRGMNSYKRTVNYCEVCGSQTVGVRNGVCANCRKMINYAKRTNGKPLTGKEGFGSCDTTIADRLNREVDNGRDT